MLNRKLRFHFLQFPPYFVYKDGWSALIHENLMFVISKPLPDYTWLHLYYMVADHRNRKSRFQILEGLNWLDSRHGIAVHS